MKVRECRYSSAGFLNGFGAVYLAWQAEVTYTSDEGPARDIEFADAKTGEVVARHPQIHHALVRQVYNANNGTSLPGRKEHAMKGQQ